MRVLVASVFVVLVVPRQAQFSLLQFFLVIFYLQ